MRDDGSSSRARGAHPMRLPDNTHSLVTARETLQFEAAECELTSPNLINVSSALRTVQTSCSYCATRRRSTSSRSGQATSISVCEKSLPTNSNGALSAAATP